MCILAASVIIRTNILVPRRKATHQFLLEYASFLSDKNITWEATGGQFCRAYDIIRLSDYLIQEDRDETLLTKEPSRLMSFSFEFDREKNLERIPHGDVAITEESKTSIGEIPGMSP